MHRCACTGERCECSTNARLPGERPGNPITTGLNPPPTTTHRFFYYSTPQRTSNQEPAFFLYQQSSMSIRVVCSMMRTGLLLCGFLAVVSGALVTSGTGRLIASAASAASASTAPPADVMAAVTRQFSRGLEVCGKIRLDCERAMFCEWAQRWSKSHYRNDKWCQRNKRLDGCRVCDNCFGHCSRHAGFSSAGFCNGRLRWGKKAKICK